MAKTIITVKTFTYVVYTDTVCTVTDTETGRALATAVPGVPNYFTAMGGSVTLSDDAATLLKPVFKCAPDAMGLLVGGPKLPAGHTKLDFLVSTGTQYLVLPVEYGQTSGVAVSYKVKRRADFSYLSIIRYSDQSVQIGRISGDGMTGIAATSSPTVTAFVANNGQIFAAYNEYESKKIKVASQSEEVGSDIPHTPAVGETVTPVYLMAYDRTVNLGVYLPSPAHYSLYEARFTLGPKLVNRFVPALAPDGTPCMYDSVTGTTCRNAGEGQFVAGIGTISQLLCVLRHLPVTEEVRELALSLPAEANTPEIAEMMDSAGVTKGWTLTVYEYRAAAAAAVTYSLRRVREVVWCRKVAAEYGGYVDTTGTRWQVERCAAVFGPLGQDPGAYGYAPFDSVEHAAEVWELVPYQTPEEEILTSE